MNLKGGPLFLIIFLLLILAFILGVRHGQQVEKTNKTINYLLSITPTKPPTPTPTPFVYQTHKSKKWGLRFIYPSFLDVTEDPTAPAVYFQLKK